MPIKLGNKNIGNIFKGDTPIDKVFRGEDLIFSSFTPEIYLSFDGVDDYVTIPYSNDFNIGTNDFTIMWTENFKGSPNELNIRLSYGGLNDSNTLYLFSGDANGSYRLRINAGAVFGINGDFNASVITNAITDLAVVRENGEVTFYINGVSQGTATNSFASASINKNVTLGIGRDQIRGDRYFEGDIYNFSIFNGRALTSTEINNFISNPPTGNETDLVLNYKINEGSGTILNDSAENNDGTIVGATWEQE
jgi:hypothetical protein